MLKNIIKGVEAFNARIQEDHTGAYAATCAFFIVLSFTPLIMIVLAIARRASLDETMIMNTLISVVPAGIRDLISTIIDETYAKSYAVVPVSVLILLWAASKFIHALTNSLNVISHVKETRGWVYTRIRSMIFVAVFIGGITFLAFLSNVSHSIRNNASEAFPLIGELVQFFMPFRSLIGYVALIIIFMLIYTILPNCHYTFGSQFPGALMVATVWIMVSYFVTLYYTHNRSFSSMYGSMTGLILAMIWLFFCMFFLLFGAEINRVIYENPEDNVIVNTIQDVRTETMLRSEANKKEIQRQKIQDTDDVLNSHHMKKILSEEREDHELDEETGIDLSLVRQGVYQHEDIMEDEDE